MKIVKRISKKKKFGFKVFSWYEHILFWYSHLTFPDESSCTTNAGALSRFYKLFFSINPVSTEFSRHRDTLVVLHRYAKHPHASKTAAAASPLTFPPVVMVFTVSLSWGRLLWVWEAGKVTLHLQWKCNKLKTTWEIIFKKKPQFWSTTALNYSR